MKKVLSLIAALTLAVACLGGCKAGKAPLSETNPDAQIITLSGGSATLDGVPVEEFDYTWHCDPSVSHEEVKNAPAEYYTGTKPQTDAAVYIDHELYYYPQLPESGFTLQNYDGEREWTYHYTDGVHNEYIFATLPALGNSLPTQMMHTPEEAAKNKVLHITKPGTYALEGDWDGQIWVDLGDKDDAFTDQKAAATLLLNGVDITCTVAPGVVFYSAYECDNAWEDREEHTAQVDLSKAGATVSLVDGTDNKVSGQNIYRMLKTVYKDEDEDEAVKVQKKMRKIDAAFYSYVSMTIGGEGALQITSGFEGLDSELHLGITGGDITIDSQDDGINVNEDNVSVVSFTGGTVTLNAAQGAEGDGVDSNGYVVIDGGTLAVNGVTAPDSAIDSEDGIHYLSGKILIDGQEQTYTPGSVFRETGKGGMGNMGGFGGDKNFGDRPGMPGDTEFDLEKFKQQVAALPDDATLEDVLALLGIHNFPGERPESGTGGDGQQPPAWPGNRI